MLTSQRLEGLHGRINGWEPAGLIAVLISLAENALYPGAQPGFF